MKSSFFKHPAFTLLIILAVAAILVVLPLIPAAQYWGLDELSAAGFDTEKKLAAYERSGDPSDIRAWLAHNNNGGIGMQVYITLSQWSMTHQGEFVRLAESFDTNQKKQFVETFVFTLGDTRQSDEFHRAYKSSKSRIISEIIRRAGGSARGGTVPKLNTLYGKQRRTTQYRD